MILIIDNYDSFTYNLYQIVAQLVAEIKVIRNDKITIEEISLLQPSGIIISPGPGRPENAGIGIDIVKHFSKSIPILGVCLGHQIITVAFGGKVDLAPIPVHGKTTYVFHNRRNIYQNMPLPFQAGRYHSLIAVKSHLTAELVVEAENNDGLIMGIRHVQYPTFGVQFHPESILTPHGDILLKNFMELCNHSRIFDVKKLHSTINASTKFNVAAV